jgi:hypothetical protein
MKNIAKLALFFTVSFVSFFVIALLLGFVSSWIELIKIIPTEIKIAEDVADSAWEAIPAAIYLSILMGLGFTVKKAMPIAMSIICMVILCFTFTTGISLGISRAGTIKPVLMPVNPVKAEPGLILTQGENTIVLLKESTEMKGPRLVSIPGRPLIYQSVPIGPNNTILSLPAIQFGDTVPWFIRSIGIDLSLSAWEFKNRFQENLIFFAAYAISLILLLSSLRFLVELSQWPLANIFFGALIFRLILALETFLNSREINALIDSFLGMVSPPLITPAVFLAFGLITILYTFLTKVARSTGRRSKRDRDD